MAGPPMTPSEKIVLALACSSRGHGLEHQRLRLGQQSAAAESLDDAADDQHGQVGREAAQDRGEHEGDERKNEVALLAEAQAEPRRERNDDDVGDRVAGRDPADFRERRAEVALHVRQRDVDDADVDHLQNRRERGGEDDGPFEPALFRRALGQAGKSVAGMGHGHRGAHRSMPFRKSSTQVST